MSRRRHWLVCAPFRAPKQARPSMDTPLLFQFKINKGVQVISTFGNDKVHNCSLMAG
jgi:hypothetical protein